ncbi:MAG: CBS domain-containing protein [Peptococcaceae bacterium]|jgi:CBS domain-containing protein|nr:CBS domain-containing protein [Peptococcaceae bacterium]
MKVKEIMSTDVVFVDGSARVPEIAKVMKQNGIGAVPVVKSGKVVGIITDRDIVLRVLADNKDYNTVTAEQIMSDDPVCIEENSDIDRAADIMAEYQIKRLPVLHKGNLVGIISLGDLAIEQIYMDEAGEALSGISRGISH